MDYSKTLEQLEKEYWKHINFPTTLVQKCHEFRRIPLNELKPNQLRLLISQNIGLIYLIPMAIEILKEDILIEIEFYEGDLLSATITSDPSFWNKNASLRKEMSTLLTEKRNIFPGNKKLNKETETFLQSSNSIE